MARTVRNGAGALASPIAKTVVLVSARALVTKRPRSSSARSPATGKRNLEVSGHLFPSKGDGPLGNQQGNLPNFSESLVMVQIGHAVKKDYLATFRSYVH